MRKETQKLLVLSLLGLISVNLTAQQKAKKDTIKGLDEVVVTALGIKRHDKSLGYSTQTVKSDEILQTQNNNWAQSLEGKVAGLKIQTAGAGPLGTSRITLRGDISMNMGNNGALIVVDGVPLSDKKTGTGTSAYGAGSGGDLPIDYGDSFNSINPDDIESVSILKGPSASALYGSRGSRGAIMITTKSGKTKKGQIQVTLNSYSSYDTVLKWPDYQYEYGQGTQQKDKNGNYYYSYGASPDGVNTGSTSSAFGPKFGGQYYFQYDPTIEGQSLERQLWRPYKNNIKDFWQTGATYSNSLSIAHSNETTAFRTSLSYLKNEWMMPNTGFNRLNAAISLDHKLSNKIKIGTKVNFSQTTSDNLPATGYNNQSISYFMIFQNPNVDLEWYKPIWRKGQDQVDQIHPFSSYIDNPYLIAYENVNTSNKKILTGNLNISYQLAKNFEIAYKSGLEWSNEMRTQRRPWSSANYLKGYYRESYIRYLDLNNDLLLTYKNKFGDFGVTASAGGSIRYYESTLSDYRAIGLNKAGLYQLSNATSLDNRLPKPNDNQVNSMYALANFSYKDMIFVDVTARNDWSSTLPSHNRSYFYPSVSSSFILSDLFKVKSDNFNFWKLRLSWSKVGNDTYNYMLDKYYENSVFSGSVESPLLYPNPDLKPEMITNIEGGMDFTLLKNRLTLNFTAYQINSKNQSIVIPVLYETGYNKRIINSGELRNRGIELTLNAYPIKNKNFSWSVNANWSMNRNKIISLPDEFQGQPYTMASVGGVVYYNAVVGGSLGDMYGYGLMYSPDGKVIYGSDGLTAKPTEMKKIGNAYPKWRAGLQNEFKYKNFTVSFSFDGQYKGMAYSQSHHKMSEQGKLVHTLEGRDNPGGLIVGQGVVQNPDGTFSPNTKGIPVSTYYGDYYRRANVETNSFDTSFIKLRDARISYSFPKSVTESLKMTDITLALFGRNLWMWTKFPLFDPEAATLDDSTITPGVEMGQLPTARTVGIQLNVKF
ncbi:SusC/RagA family TonB-linked outer membrane protein [Chryseobacterium lactis]|uniref:SusC/RagA family TonB-linked outer membrane protein n=1 Tax=Chryseobacterium lactis TaxID=1241981 RepID=A0A3G6RGL8_CHRLC|nr:SusC/RagA family TonB-linked outer membrane protein [Chryseobacterium lactis]AZA82612.1 SusC/RagA family TonB-linked outer membrane protein [Chryseobacterium lactis]AZB02993.1 SusC/RagA family TonB-linked outer membrane protein [Chryseobacterium lactis]PNW11867.1 SusC/RagA family TonB-linked outer membrane protein [Chryseobacterium lactis]